MCLYCVRALCLRAMSLDVTKCSPPAIIDCEALYPVEFYYKNRLLAVLMCGQTRRTVRVCVDSYHEESFYTVNP